MSAVERADIERRDFPVVRRGYDQAAVDAHLRRVADAFESVRTPLATGASEQVRAILEAAEAGAAEIRADAGRRVAGVEQAGDGLAERLAELASLLESVRRSGDQVSGAIARMREQVGSGLPAPEAAAPAVAEETGPEEPVPPDVAAPPAGDEAGARLIALNMALSGTSRDETARYLAEHFELSDADALLDDVYARAAR
jgi:DivIVA domain-containing protein